MSRARVISADYPAFAGLPESIVTVGNGNEQMAVHVAGRLGRDQAPLVCIPGYNRNMADFAEFVPLLRRLAATDFPVVLVDLLGRGRSADRRRSSGYSTVSEARDLEELARALGVETDVLLGQGHGGQVIMSLAAERPTLIAGAVLIDAGPAIAPASLVRLRSNCEAIAGLRGATGLTLMLRRMLAADYPDATPEHLDRLAARTHLINAGQRALPLFDPALIERLRDFAPDDVLVPQWQFLELLGRVPLMLLRTEFTDQLDWPILEEMMRRRPDAQSLSIARQGSPALLDRPDEVAPIAAFMDNLARPAERTTRRA